MNSCFRQFEIHIERLSESGSLSLDITCSPVAVECIYSKTVYDLFHIGRGFRRLGHAFGKDSEFYHHALPVSGRTLLLHAAD